MANQMQIAPFAVKNCALAAIATGERAGSLSELRDRIANTNIGCIYYHFWGNRIHPQLAHSEYYNDFAEWVRHKLHDDILAERLGVLDPTEYNSLEDLRQDLVEVIDQHIAESELIPWTRKENQFHFIRSKIIIFETSIRITLPQELQAIVPNLSPSSMFYHFIDAKKRTNNGKDDFSAWLRIYGEKYNVLIQKIESIDPYFTSMTELRDELSREIQEYFSSNVESEKK